MYIFILFYFKLCIVLAHSFSPTVQNAEKKYAWNLRKWKK